MPSILFPDAVITGELLAHLRGLPDRYELVEGSIVPLSPCNVDHARAVAHLTVALSTRLDLGRWSVLAGEPGIHTHRKPDTIRGADVAVISHRRLEQRDPARAFLTVAPELVIEVRSPGNETDLDAKVREYLAAGVLAVWVLDLEAREVLLTTAEGAILVEAAEAVRMPDDTAVAVADLFPHSR